MRRCYSQAFLFYLACRAKKCHKKKHNILNRCIFLCAAIVQEVQQIQEVAYEHLLKAMIVKDWQHSVSTMVAPQSHRKLINLPRLWLLSGRVSSFSDVTNFIVPFQELMVLIRELRMMMGIHETREMQLQAKFRSDPKISQIRCAFPMRPCKRHSALEQCTTEKGSCFYFILWPTSESPSVLV